MSTAITKLKATALVAAEPHVERGAALFKSGKREAGLEWKKAREAIGWSGGSGKPMPYEYAKLLAKHGVESRTEREAVQFADDEQAHERKIERTRKSRETAHVRRFESSENNEIYIPPSRSFTTPVSRREESTPERPQSNDGIDEAWRGFKAAQRRFFTSLDKHETADARRWHATAMQHFKVLVERSGLASMVGATSDEVVTLLNFYSKGVLQ